uniref:Cell division protein ZapB n=1 Tax=uncultured myxobacterium HF0200_01L06 TaxID=723556 RepID=E7C3J8_9BACT|nr:hypothetical protein [uncultured myxobacterium HF0200_01L06]
MSFLRLERAVAKLVEEHERLLLDQTKLRNELAERDQRVAQFEKELLEAGQRRVDAAKRIDALIARLDEIESEVMAEATPVVAARGK